MARTLLQLVAQACGEIGIPQPQFLFGSQNDTETQLIAQANRTGKEIASAANKNGGWQELRIPYTFNTVVNQASYNLPDDLDYFVDQTFWNDKYKWELIGPITAQERQILTYGVVASGPRPKFYIQQNKIWLNPAPQEVQLVAYQYYSKYWCLNQSAIPQQFWQNDTDTFRLDEELFILGLKWRFLRMKGFSYDQEKEDYELDMQRTVSRDGGMRDLSLNGGGYETNFLGNDNIPDSGYGQ